MFDDNPAQQTAFNREKSYHPSDYPHVFTFSLVWDVPFGPGRKWNVGQRPRERSARRMAAGDRQLLHSGSRLFVTTNNTLPFFNIGLRPDLVSSDIRSDISMSDYDPNDPARNTYLQRSAFAAPQPGKYGNAPRALEISRAHAPG